MNERDYSLLGIVGPLLGYLFIGTAISQSPWFRWEKNALSDLGHSTRSSVAPVFNFGLLLTGLCIAAYVLLSLRHLAKWTSLSLLLSGFSLQLVATFDEVYGFLHFAVSVLFFLSIGVSSIVYAAEKKSYLGVVAFVIGLAAWMLYWMRVYVAGVAVPETISTLVVLPLIMSTAMKIYHKK
jgi:hypothetical membrane protein